MFELRVKHPKYPEGAAAEAVKCLEHAKISAEVPAEGDKENELGEAILILNPR